MSSGGEANVPPADRPLDNPDMPERGGAPADGAPQTLALPLDRERDAGFRGEAFERAAWMFGLVFALGFAVLAMVLVTRRRR